MELIDASVSKNASKTPALLNRSKRFHTLFQGPKRSGSAPANGLDGEDLQRLEEAAIVLGLPPTTQQAGANTASVCAQSSSSIVVDIGPGPLIGPESDGFRV